SCGTPISTSMPARHARGTAAASESPRCSTGYCSRSGPVSQHHESSHGSLRYDSATLLLGGRLLLGRRLLLGGRLLLGRRLLLAVARRRREPQLHAIRALTRPTVHDLGGAPLFVGTERVRILPFVGGERPVDTVFTGMPEALADLHEPIPRVVERGILGVPGDPIP